MTRKFLGGTIAIMVLLLVSIVGAASTIPSSEKIDITLVNQAPEPVEPGDQVKLKFRIENEGSKIADNVEVEILEEHPFSLISTETAIRNIGTLEGVQTGTAGVTVEYKLKVDEDASEGNNEIRVRYRTDKSEWVTMPEFTIRVESPDAFLAIKKVETNPPTIVPGQTATLTFTLENMAQTLLRDIDVKLNISGASTPFIPVESSAIKKIGRISAGNTATITFDITALPTASGGMYKVPIELTYSDEVPNTYTKTSIIGLRVGSEPDLSLSVDSFDSTGDVSIKIVNKGLTDLKLMNAILMETDQYEIVSNEEEYIGNIDSDDYETVEFMIKTKATGNVELKLTLEYLDANNVKYTEERTATIKNAVTTSNGNGKGSVIGYIIIAVIVIGGIFFYIRHKKKKKK